MQIENEGVSHDSNLSFGTNTVPNKSPNPPEEDSANKSPNQPEEHFLNKSPLMPSTDSDEQKKVQADRTPIKKAEIEP